MKKCVALLLALCLLLPFAAAAGDVGTAARISFVKEGDRTETLTAGTDKAAYISGKKEEFRSMLDRYVNGPENTTVDNWESLFTRNAYAEWETVSVGGVVLDMSDDAIVIGDEDDWQNMYVVSGTVTRVTFWNVSYTLVTVADAGSSAGQIDRVTLTVTPPRVGERTSDVAPDVTVNTGERYSVVDTLWLFGPNMYSTGIPDYLIEEGETYYIYVVLKAEEGLQFNKNGTPTTGIDEGFVTFGGCEAVGGEVIFAASRTFSDGDYLRVKLAVTPGQEGALKGDVDRSGKVDSTDARLVLQLTVNKIRESDLPAPAAADADGNKAITSTDARLILQYAVGKITAWP